MHLTHGKEEPTPNPFRLRGYATARQAREGNWEEPTRPSGPLPPLHEGFGGPSRRTGWYGLQRAPLPGGGGGGLHAEVWCGG